MSSLLSATLAAITPPSATARAAAADRLDRMTKPPGSLGRIEDLAVTLAGIAGTCPPPLPDPAVVMVCAGDHGVHAQGVTPWPQEVTGQMVANFAAGGAVVNAFARAADVRVTVLDVGVAAPLPALDGVLDRRVADGTADLAVGPALTREQVVAAVEAGIAAVPERGCVLTGDMGIANTTAAALLICAFTGADPDRATGRGTGIDDATLARKTGVVRDALARHRPDPSDPIGVLAAFGGLEHAAIAGLVLGAAARRIPVLLDGVSAGAAALVAAALSPRSVAYCVAGHRSAEPGHRLALGHLGLDPLLDLGLRLGEGTGAVLALPLLRAAVRALHDVATFGDAGVTDAATADAGEQV
ncbi:nicotinate-nucleotide--dimethylbenzimidazole phosphoribosyltransferase [Pseudonocardia broussonetiae]|uniref:Nicotinate-nucleotide--dimethylbenzimidazole phosphoribosyltransferase n=1 Tax=Pseudonocardia broussonetiae TaxID=2736640 RepID=A0A6M6JKW3_9PSEU|nr:nicotinate-nucleotide--dimethylbenzimidazole phosphoribosyltransferase [Pseudonocardia broussonetiae]QJY47597.1 nicotinate-nucleotide--dimethylbenzimidazole phosphoribosyltransferase [Pseudonocardia broussonetiae]